MQKPLLFAAIALSLGAAVLGFLNHQKLDSLRQAAEQAKSQSDQQEKKLTAALKENKDLKAAKEAASNASKDKESELSDLKAQKDSWSSKQADLEKQIADKDAAIAQQKTDLAAKDSRISDLESKSGGSTSTGGSDDAKKQLEEQKVLSAKLETKLKEQESQLALLKEREAQRRNKIMRNGLEGRVLAVNPSWNFVVLSLGDRNGVVNNAEMLIKRGSQLIGKVRITSVEPSTSVADIVANSVRNGTVVQPGDTVIYMGPGEETAEAKVP